MNQRRSSNSFIGTLILALLCVIGVGVLQVPRLNQLLSSPKTVSLGRLRKETETEKLHLNFLRQLPTFGFDNLAADSTFLSFLQYFGDDEARARTGYSLSPDYLDVVLAHDPYFLQAYLFLSTSTSLYAGMPERSEALMNKWSKFLSPTVPSKSYYVWRYKGVDELLFLGDAQAARRSFEKTAQWASYYADDESQQVESISRRMTQFLARNPRSRSAQIAAWALILNNPIDAETRKRVIQRIETLGGRVLVTPQGVQIRSPKGD